MNYGYDKNTVNWKEERKLKLAKELCKKLPANYGWTPGGVTPYVEIDGLYEGVRIRKISNLSDEDIDNFIKKADEIYNEVMTDD